MRFADAGWPQEDDVFTPLDEAELVETLHLLPTERRLEGKIKLGEPLDGGQATGAHRGLQASVVAQLNLRVEQLLDRGHKYGPDSSELRVTLGEMDRHLARMLRALEAKVGDNYLLAVTADHGMPSEPSSPDRRHFAQSIVDLLHERFDPETKQLITSFEPENSQIFVDEDRLSALHLTLRDLAYLLESQPFVFAVFTHDDVRLAANAAK